MIAAARRRGLVPHGDERRILGRFYLADFVGYASDVASPFQFVYLFLVLDWSEWAVLPFVFESAAFLLLELGTGVWADRYGRRRSVLIGNALIVLAYVAVPLAAALEAGPQLAAVCACFTLIGFGETLCSGAEEAWVVDNLFAARRPDLLEVYFARAWSFSSAGGVVAGVVALVLLFVFPVSRALIDLLWLVAAGGFLLSTWMLASLPERSLPPRPGVAGLAPVDGDEGRRAELVGAAEKGGLVVGLRVVRRTAGLLMLFLAYTIASFSGGSVDEAFDMALVTRGLDARAFALLGIAGDILGIVAPLVGLALARRLGARRALALLLVIPAGIVTVFFTRPTLWVVALLAVLLDLCDGAWDPVAQADLHRAVPSRVRATVASAFEQAGGIAEIASLLAFSALMGEQGRVLRDATPDLVDAFSGGATARVPVPTGPLGLPVPGAAIVLFVLFGLVAVPLLLRRHGGRWSAGVTNEAGARLDDGFEPQPAEEGS